MCIRDRTQSTWDGKVLKPQQKVKRGRSPARSVHQRKMSLNQVVLILGLVSLVLGNLFPNYDRCDPQWVKLIQSGELYDCANPAAKNPVIKDASTFIAIANIATKQGLTVNGKTATPKVIAEFIAEGQKQGRWKSVNDVFIALGLDVKGIMKDHKAIREHLKAGGDVVVTITRTNQAVAIFSLGGGIINAVDSRGKRFAFEYNVIDVQVLMVKVLKHQLQNDTFGLFCLRMANE
eukprot:TRINITY_DN1560_c0_g2_i2.p1 TRINITY_DN1560_c0_g2~~TRINITY_DN1560_c0_g2_i2.p1  ORF type:complete len:234 (-),score=55.02 TRINITY_DN1560_c0_g2_i2:160-861(-)